MSGMSQVRASPATLCYKGEPSGSTGQKGLGSRKPAPGAAGLDDSAAAHVESASVSCSALDILAQVQRKQCMMTRKG